MAKEGVRIAFKYGDWQPTQSQWLYAASCIQVEEQNRVAKFVYKKDAKAALTGRLLIRKVVSEFLGIPYRDVTLLRTDKGKPYLKDATYAGATQFSFNMSHQGDYTVLAAELKHLVGVDTMKVEWPSQRSVDQFFTTMRRQLTDHEWSVIEAGSTDWHRLRRFYRHWCLKESYVKALGIGIGYSLKRLNFHLSQPDLPPDTITTDTTVRIDGALSSQWHFEEQMCGENHIVAVAMRDTPLSPDHECDNSLVIDYVPRMPRRPEAPPPRPCEIIDWDELISNSEPIMPVDPKFWTTFDAKSETSQLPSQLAVLPD